MELVKRIIVADSDRESRITTIQAIQSEGDIAVVADTASGETLIQLVKEHLPDLILMDVILEEKDGMDTLDAISELDLPYRPKILVLSNYALSDVLTKKQVHYILHKPCAARVICERIRNLTGKAVTPDSFHGNASLERKISSIMQAMGFPANLLGYQFACSAIVMSVQSPTKLAATKILYPQIAIKYDSTSPRVERAIRHAISKAWDNAAIQFTAYGMKKKPTNSHFIAAIAQSLKTEYKECER